jgi:hypothetical protein
MMRYQLIEGNRNERCAVPMIPNRMKADNNYDDIKVVIDSNKYLKLSFVPTGVMYKDVAM